MKSSLAYLILTVFLLMSCGKKSETPDASKAIDTIPMLVERVQKALVCTLQNIEYTKL